MVITCILLFLNLIFGQTFAIYSTSTVELGTKSKPDALFAPWHAQITYPTATSSSKSLLSELLPIYLFVSGFGGQYDVTKYSQVLSEISSHGVVVVGIDRKFKLQAVINYTQLAESLNPVLDYVKNNSTNINKLLTNCVGVPNPNHLIVGGHSAGNHIIVRRLATFFDSTDAKSVVMIDPVDGEDPFGIVKQFVIHPPHKVNFQLPALHIETGLDPVGHPACAPRSMSNDRFYDAWNDTIYQMNFTQMGHMDLINSGSSSLSKIVCPSSKNRTIVEPIYRKLIGNAVHAFIVKDVAVLEGAVKVKEMNVLYKHKGT